MNEPPNGLVASLQWLFRDRSTGEMVVAQFPNPPLWIFLVTVGARWFVPEDDTWHDVLGWIGLFALLWWAIDELVRGVNPWRRLLGAAIAIVVVTAAVSNLS
jgi:hypothetical protein